MFFLCCCELLVSGAVSDIDDLFGDMIENGYPTQLNYFVIDLLFQ